MPKCMYVYVCIQYAQTNIEHTYIHTYTCDVVSTLSLKWLDPALALCEEFICFIALAATVSFAWCMYADGDFDGDEC